MKMPVLLHCCLEQQYLEGTKSMELPIEEKRSVYHKKAYLALKEVA